MAAWGISNMLLHRVIFISLWLLFLCFLALKPSAQSPLSCDEQLMVVNRTLAVVRDHELEITKTAAAYSLRFEAAEAKIKELQAQLDSKHE